MSKEYNNRQVAEHIITGMQKVLDTQLEKVKQTPLYKSAIEMQKKSVEIESLFYEKFKIPCRFHYNIYKNIIYIKQDDRRAYTAQTYATHEIGYAKLKVAIGLEILLPFTERETPSLHIRNWLKDLLDSEDNVFTPYYRDGVQEEMMPDITDTIECDICQGWYLPDNYDKNICYNCRKKL